MIAVGADGQTIGVLASWWGAGHYFGSDAHPVRNEHDTDVAWFPLALLPVSPCVAAEQIISDGLLYYEFAVVVNPQRSVLGYVLRTRSER